MKKILIIILIFLIILLNFKLLVFNDKFYDKEFMKNNMDSNLLEENKEKLFDYFKGENLDTDFFNEKEKLHLVDVKNLIQKTFILLYIVLIVFVLLLFYLIYNKKYLVIGDSFIFSGIITMGFLIILSLFSFSSLFYKFHLLFFKNNLWLLDPLTDNLIKMFPEWFFYDFFKRLVLNSFFTSLFLIIIGGIIKYVCTQHKSSIV
ncbi:MAG: DUF1461 domain-containing protein [Nanoarchaeota archaeon]|nr:DUF1461 domain-containing protein [Nanoarchaeota archaeon]